MKLNNTIFTYLILISAMFMPILVMADDAPPAATVAEADCIEKIATDENFTKFLNDNFGTQTVLSSDIIKLKEAEMYEVIATAFFDQCKAPDNIKDWNTVADADSFAFKFEFKGKKYHITLNADELFAWKGPQETRIAVFPNTLPNLAPGVTVGRDEIEDYFYKEQCSPHGQLSWYKDNRDFNKAAKEVFKDIASWWFRVDSSMPVRYVKYDDFFLTSKHGPFRGLAFGQSNNALATPLRFLDYRVARRKARELAEKLKSTKCVPNYVVHISLHPDDVFQAESYTSFDKVPRALLLSEPFPIEVER